MRYYYLVLLFSFFMYENLYFCHCCCCGDCGVSEGRQISASSKINDQTTNLGGKKDNNKGKRVGKSVDVANFIKKGLFNTYKKKKKNSKNNNSWKIDEGGDINKTTEEVYTSNKDSLYKSFIDEFKVIENKNIDEITNGIVSHHITFDNLCNTCYLNSCLQFLTHNYEFVKFVLENIIKIKDTDDRIKNATISMSLCRLLLCIYGNNNNQFVIDRLLESILYFFLHKETEGKEGYNNNYKYEEFHFGEQADIYQFLVHFFDDLEAEFNTKLYEVFLTNNINFLYIQEKKKFNRGQDEKNYVLMLEVKDKNNNLNTMIEKINNQPEKIKDFISGGEKVEAIKQIFYDQESKNFLIYLKRYSYNEEKKEAKKNDADVEFGEVIEIGDAESDKKKYEIVSVIVQIGGVNAGHYICYVKIGGNWFLFDDNILTKFTSFNEAYNYKLSGPYEAGLKKAYFISAKLIEDKKKD